MTTITINKAGLTYAAITVNADSVIETNEALKIGSQVWFAVVVDGQAYPLALVKHLDGRPELLETINDVLNVLESAVIDLNEVEVTIKTADATNADVEQVAKAVEFGAIKVGAYWYPVVNGEAKMQYGHTFSTGAVGDMQTYCGSYNIRFVGEWQRI